MSVPTNLFSASDDREPLASALDALALVLAALPLWLLHDAIATADIIARPLASSTFVAIMTIGIVTFVLSLVTTLVQQEYSFRPEPQIDTRRSLTLTVAAVIAAIALVTAIGIFLNGLIPNNSISSSDPLHVALTFSVVVVPAVIRLTSPSAFVYKPEYFQEAARPIIGQNPA